ncbi:DUF7260 family protein [Halorubrum laminariae]|uniref:DUF7260 domain-containing protein n=1 Tax=Halorubrum laminariae TaxID=1433523 RepID=A0ABD6BWS2_9EURY|nr:hypothetical protein [Halorubrum laminariae]
MTVRTHVRRALDRVADERKLLTEKRTAFDEFERTVRDLDIELQSGTVARSDAASGDAMVASASPVGRSGPTTDGCRPVRDAFAETVHPYRVEDHETPEPLSETMRTELTDDLAAALAPESSGRFTPMTKRAVLSAVAERKRELRVTEHVLGAEARSLRSAADEIEDVVEWLVEADETPLTELGFDGLRTRHDELASLRTQCAAVCRERQAFLNGATSKDAEVGITHRSLVEYVYADLSVTYPVLCTATRLNGICDECQHAVRGHLVRRA